MIFIVVGLLVGCSGGAQQPVDEISEEALQHLMDGKYEEVLEIYVDDSLKASMSEEELKQEWESRTLNSGELLEDVTWSFSETGSHEIAEAELVFTDVIFQIRLTFNEARRIAGIYFSHGYANAQLPDSVFEEEVVVGVGTEFELGGTLTLPENLEEGSVPAVVLVQGSGPSNRDEAVYGYRPFRDIAWGLAEQGIAVLRYDKRTYTYRNEMAQQETITVKEETVDDAILAAELLKGDTRIDADNVYIVGHSLGGMLAPRIDAEGGDFAGIVVLGGSARPLWEIIYDQNLHFLATEDFDEAAEHEYLQMLEIEREKAERMSKFTEEDAKAETIFGLPAFYFLEMDSFPTRDVLEDFEKPIFILHGEDDFQVTMEQDFPLWKELLGENEWALIQSYEGLNHFFISYEGPHKGTINEYDYPNIVDRNVISDIGQWIWAQVE
ncbi:alpha/beta fold hydrolase [Evansella sp. AB-rgal1]|uniref:alpha/beta hydrolase n=1 Tax=Evansella sp. AB-rgal1 TaxID=3242696 RepID=UPI00359D1191